jgi:hypothetical protein
MGRFANTSSFSPEEQDFWRRFCALMGTEFTTRRGLKYTFSVQGNEVFFNRKEKSVTVATVMQAYRKAMEQLQKGKFLKGPSCLGGFGASYLFPIILRVLKESHPEDIRLLSSPTPQNLPFFDLT